MDRSIHKLSIEGFKSIQQLTDFPLKPLNILIGANGSGKSNLITFFHMLKNIMKRNLQYYIQKNGGPDVHLFMGAKVTEIMGAKICFSTSTWELEFEPTYDNRLLITREQIYSNETDRIRDRSMDFVACGFYETKVVEKVYEGPWTEIVAEIYKNITNWEFYHFHITSDLAKLKRPEAINHNERLDEDGGNLAAFLYPLY